MNTLRPLAWIALAIAAAASHVGIASACPADDIYCAETPVVYVEPAPIFVEPQQPSWIFLPSTYTHDPLTGARVAQYERKPPVEPLEDERAVTSSYRRTRTVLRGRDGSTDTYYQVQAWGNGRGGIDAEWERFHDAWKESILSGGYFNSSPGQYGYGGNGYGYGGPGYGYGGQGYGYGGPGYGYGGPGMGNGFPPGNGPQGPPHGSWQEGWNNDHGGGSHDGHGQQHGHWQNGHGQSDNDNNDHSQNDHGHND